MDKNTRKLSKMLKNMAKEVIREEASWGRKPGFLARVTKFFKNRVRRKIIAQTIKSDPLALTRALEPYEMSEFYYCEKTRSPSMTGECLINRSYSYAGGCLSVRLAPAFINLYQDAPEQFPDMLEVTKGASVAYKAKLSQSIVEKLPEDSPFSIKKKAVLFFTDSVCRMDLAHNYSAMQDLLGPLHKSMNWAEQLDDAGNLEGAHHKRGMMAESVWSAVEHWKACTTRRDQIRSFEIASLYCQIAKPLAHPEFRELMIDLAVAHMEKTSEMSRGGDEVSNWEWNCGLSTVRMYKDNLKPKHRLRVGRALRVLIEDQRVDDGVLPWAVSKRETNLITSNIANLYGIAEFASQTLGFKKVADRAKAFGILLEKSLEETISEYNGVPVRVEVDDRLASDLGELPEPRGMCRAHEHTSYVMLTEQLKKVSESSVEAIKL